MTRAAQIEKRGKCPACYAMPRPCKVCLDHAEKVMAEKHKALPEDSEPVAWRHWCECDTDEKGNPIFDWEYFDKASCPECQPLYTHPPKDDQKYWLCCGGFDTRHDNERCHEYLMGNKHHVRYGTAKEHSEWQKGTMPKYPKRAELVKRIDEVWITPLAISTKETKRLAEELRDYLTYLN
jgi:hypothetical protein